MQLDVTQGSPPVLTGLSGGHELTVAQQATLLDLEAGQVYLEVPAGPTVTLSGLDEAPSLTLAQNAITLTIGGEQGPAGPPGEGGTVVIATAGEDLSAGLVSLYSEGGVLLARGSSALTYGADGFITQGYAAGAAEVHVRRSGLLGGLSGLTAGELVFLGEEAGALVHDVSTYPAGHRVQQVGFAVGADSALIDLGPAITLA